MKTFPQTVSYDRTTLSDIINNASSKALNKCQLKSNVEYQLFTGTTILYERLTISELKSIVYQL